MKNLSIFLFVLFVILCFANTQSLAQNKAKSKEVIIVEFLIPYRDDFAKSKITINKNSKSKISDGGVSISECGFPETEECKTFISTNYEFLAKADELSKISTKVTFNIEVTDGCKTKKIFTVYRNQKTKLKLKCGVTLIARYVFASEETN